jgi:biotin carboxylase
VAFNKDKVMDAARKFVDKGQIDKAVKEYLRIVHDVDRPAAIRRARRCLDEMVIEGPRTNIPFLRRIINNPDFIRGEFDTGFVARLLADRASAA